jgi:hypothetical protein
LLLERWWGSLGRVAEERVALPNLVLATAAARDIRDGAAQLRAGFDSSGLSPSVGIVDSTARGSMSALWSETEMLLATFGSGRGGARALLASWDAAGLASQQQLGLEEAEGHASPRVPLPSLDALSPALSLAQDYVTLPAVAQLVLLGIAAETGHRQLLWTPAAIRAHVGSLGDMDIEHALEALTRHGWIERSDWGEAPEGRGCVLVVATRVFLPFALTPWGGRHAS